MSLISNSTIYYINSADRLEGTDSDFLYQIVQPPDSKYDRCCVLQMSIPKSYYAVQSNEYFILEEGKSNVNIVLPVGNYTRKSFSSTLQSLLNSNSPNGWVYTITYPTSATQPDTGLFTYIVSGNSSQPSFVFTNIATNDLWSHMGFASGSTNTFVGNTLVSTQVINLQRETTIYLHSDLITNNNDNVLQEVFSSDSSDFSNIVFQQQCIEGYSKVITSNSNNVYHFYLCDENDVAINLNGQNLVVTIILYQKNNIYDMIRQFLRLKTLQD